MTYGDQFAHEVNISFHEWIYAQTGILAELVKECNNRVILFDNKNKDYSMQRMQISMLIDMVDQLMSVNCRYTNEQFELARSVREAFILSSKKPIIAEETMSEANIILQKFKAAQEKIKNNNNDNDTILLEDLLQRAHILYEEVVKKDNRSGVLRDLVVHVNAIRNSIGEELKVSKRMLECRTQLQKENAAILKKEKLRQSKELNVKIKENQRQVEQKMEVFISQLEAKWDKEKLRYHVEFHRIWERTNELEKENRTLKKKDRDMFTAIRHKVIKTFRGRKTVEPEINIKKESDYFYFGY